MVDLVRRQPGALVLLAGAGTITPMKRSGGRRVVVQVDGLLIECGTIGELGRALGRAPHTIREWERIGLIPPAPVMLPASDPRAVRRLYPLALINAVQQVALKERFGGRRQSGRFLRQQEQFVIAWNAVLTSIWRDHGVVEAASGALTDG